jgi:hypothetical protein
MNDAVNVTRIPEKATVNWVISKHIEFGPCKIANHAMSGGMKHCSDNV